MEALLSKVFNCHLLSNLSCILRKLTWEKRHGVVGEAKTHVQLVSGEVMEKDISWPQRDSGKRFRKQRQGLVQAWP